MSKFTLDFEEINTRALEYAEEIFNEIGLEGELQGDEYVCLNPTSMCALTQRETTTIWDRSSSTSKTKGGGTLLTWMKLEAWE